MSYGGPARVKRTIEIFPSETKEARVNTYLVEGEEYTRGEVKDLIREWFDEADATARMRGGRRPFVLTCEAIAQDNNPIYDDTQFQANIRQGSALSIQNWFWVNNTLIAAAERFGLDTSSLHGKTFLTTLALAICTELHEKAKDSTG